MDYCAFDNLQTGVMVVDLQHKKAVYANKSLTDLFSLHGNLEPSTMEYKLQQIMELEAMHTVLQTACRKLQKQESFEAECNLTAGSGKQSTKQVQWVLAQGRKQIEPAGTPLLYMTLTDITDRKLQAEHLRKEQEYNRIILKLADDILFNYDILNKVFTFSENFSTHYSIPTRLENFPHSLLAYGNIIPADQVEEFLTIVDNIHQGVGNYSPELSIRRFSGELVWYKIHYKLIFDGGKKPVRAIGKMTDITKQKQRMAELLEKAETDPLTKLYNKQETIHRIEQCLANSGAEDRFAMVMVDIDNFKGVNDTLGHRFGDAVLVDIAEKIRTLFRNSDIVGRVGGDEFCVFLRNIANEGAVVEKLNAICEAFRHTYTGEGGDYKISGSVGVAFYPRHGRTYETLYQLADEALYESKRRGKDCYTIYYQGIAHHSSAPRQGLDLVPQEAELYANDPIYNIFEMLYETKDIYTTINMILAMVGKRFNADRCYIFEMNEDGVTMRNTYEWCAPDIKPEIDDLQEVPVAVIAGVLSQYSKDGVFHCTDISALDENARNLLEPQGIKSMLHCAMFDQGHMRGVIGFDQCSANRIWSSDEAATLAYISKILSIFIIKKRMSSTLWHFQRQCVEMMENLNAYVYVIDLDTYETLYVNQKVLRKGFLSKGICYRNAYGRTEPCSFCPAPVLTQEKPRTAAEVQLENGTWMHVAASLVNWERDRRTALMCCSRLGSTHRH